MKYNAMVTITDYDWVCFLREGPYFSEVNFWTPTPWSVRNLAQNARVFFLQKKGDGRRVCGYGEFLRYEENSLDEAWNKYGQSNGVCSLEELKNKISGYVKANSIKEYTGSAHNIGCVILHNVVLFDEEKFFLPAEAGWDVPERFQRFKYVEDNLELLSSTDSNSEFNLIDWGDKEYKKVKRKERKGQGKFKVKLFDIYNCQCCITGETIDSALEAAHIQEYISEESNHPKNGLLLRVDFHRLFDAGLLAISNEYRVMVSNQLDSDYYQKFQGQYIFLPRAGYHPSKEALRWHYENVFRK